ncbi:MAG: hypothetical protein VB099_20295 [Candidatus Limiplasma sp.]|nr:hypothetical protein [Candidatus Limiplasma sp.]
MKQLSLLVAALLCLSGSASASVFFADDDGRIIHRDPFCMELALPDEAFPAVQFSSFNEINASSEGYLPCQECCNLYAFSRSATDQPALYYYNPEGGRMLHSDQCCPSVAAKYLPLRGVIDAVSGDTSPFSFCPVCASQDLLRHPFSLSTCFASLEEKAALLPDVWTLPSPQAISGEEALRIAKEYVHGRQEVMKCFADGLFTAGVMHYDVGCERHSQETYKVLITTVLQEPVGVVHIDAVSGEVYAWCCKAE